MRIIGIATITCSLFFSAPVWANYLDDVKASYERAQKGEENLYEVSADLNMISVSRKYNGIDTIEINAESIYLLSGEFVFLPESLSFSLSYSTNLNNLIGSSELKTSYIDTGLNIYSNDLFRSRFEYYNHRFTSIIKNNNNFVVVVEDKHGSHGNDPLFGYDIADLEYIPPNGEYKTNDSFYTRNSILLASNYDVTKNFGLSYALEEGSKPHPYEVPGATYVFADVKQKGTRTAIGYYNEDSDSKFYLKKAEIFQRKFTRYYVNKYLCSQNFYDDMDYYNDGAVDGVGGFVADGCDNVGGSIKWEGQLSKPTSGYSIAGGMNLDLYSLNVRLNASVDYEKQEFDGYLGNWDLSEETYTYTLGGGVTF